MLVRNDLASEDRKLEAEIFTTNQIVVLNDLTREVDLNKFNSLVSMIFYRRPSSPAAPIVLD